MTSARLGLRGLCIYVCREIRARFVCSGILGYTCNHYGMVIWSKSRRWEMTKINMVCLYFEIVTIAERKLRHYDILKDNLRPNFGWIDRCGSITLFKKQNLDICNFTRNYNCCYLVLVFHKFFVLHLILFSIGTLDIVSLLWFHRN